MAIRYKWIEKVEELNLYTNIKEVSIAVRETEDPNISRQATLTMSADTFWMIQ